MEEEIEQEETTLVLEDEEVVEELSLAGIDLTITRNEQSPMGNFMSLEEDEVEVVKADNWSPSIANSMFNQLYPETVLGSFHQVAPIVLVTHQNVPQVAINKLKEKCRVVFIEKKDSQEVILQKVYGVSAIFLYGQNLKIDRELLDFIGKQLAVVGLMSSGYDYVDVRELVRRKIKIGNTRTVAIDSVAEIAIGLALTVAHRFKEGYLCCTRGKWVTGGPDWLLGKQLSGSICGIIGFGKIGSAIAQKLISFNVKKIMYSGHGERRAVKESSVEFVDFDMLLAESDFVFIACPLTEETKHLFNYEKFRLMKPTSVLVNVGSGAVIKTKDLVQALNDRLIWGAGLDVTDPQPLPKDHQLLYIKSCFVTPNIGSATATTRNEMALLTVDNIIAALENSPMPCEVCFKPDPKGQSINYGNREPIRILAKHVIFKSTSTVEHI